MQVLSFFYNYPLSVQKFCHVIARRGGRISQKAGAVGKSYRLLPEGHHENAHIYLSRGQKRKKDCLLHRHPSSVLSYGTSTRRKPLLLFLLSGELLLRFDTRQFLALLFQLPPRKTRLEPSCVLLRIMIYSGHQAWNA